MFTGRFALARLLAEEIGAYRFDVNAKKLARPRLSRYGALTAGIREPQNDDEQEMVYRKVLADLPLLVKMHDVIIVDDAFHRQRPRDAFIAGARQLDDVVFVWIDAPDSTVPLRVPYLLEMGVGANEEDIYRRFEDRKTQLQFDAPPLIFYHEVSTKDAAKRLHSFIDLAIARGFTENTKRL